MKPSTEPPPFIPENGAMDSVDRDRAQWILSAAESSLVLPDGGAWRLWSADEYRWSGAQVESEHYLGQWQGAPVCAAELAPDSPLPPGWKPFPLRPLLATLGQAELNLIGRALQLIAWSRDHKWCGRCGQRTEMALSERACRCSQCEVLWYPRLTPCVIVLPVRGEELLLGHNARFPRGFYSALAGFVEPGETLEQALVREVGEETGIQVANPRYFGSQPWPFPSQLMLGFFADYEAGEPEADRVELTDVGWYHYRSLPPVPPASISIAGELIAEAVRRLSAGETV